MVALINTTPPIPMTPICPDGHGSMERTETFNWQAIYQVRWPIIYAGALSVGFAYTAQVFAQRHTEAADAAIIISAETIFAALFGYWLMGDRLDTLGIIGGALIFGCISVVQLVPLWAKIRLKAVRP